MAQQFQEPDAKQTTQRHISNWIDLVDFSTGIHDRMGSTSNELAFAPHPNVAPVLPPAQSSYTWGCYGDPNGGLRPLPGIAATITEDYFSANVANSTVGYFAGFQIVYILDTGIMANMYQRDVGLINTTHPETLFVSYQWHRDPALGTAWRRYASLQQYRLFKSVPDCFPLFTGNEAVGISEFALAYSNFCSCRVSKVSFPDTYPGNPEMVGMWSGGFGHSETPTAGVLNKIVAFPDSDSGVAGADTNANTPTQNIDCGFMFPHQGRVVLGVRGAFIASAEPAECFGFSNRIVGTERIIAGLVNRGIGAHGTGPMAFLINNQSVYVEEDPTGYGSYISMNANELFLVKNRGGAVVVRGSLDQPNVSHVPGIAEVGNANNVGALTTIGYVYGARSGVWLWAGGDTSVCISPDIDGWFWNANNFNSNDPQYPARPGLQGRFAFVYPFVYVSNNYIFDIRTKSWWRLCRPWFEDLEKNGDETVVDTPANGFAPYRFYQVTGSGSVYATPGYLGPGDRVLADIYDPTVLAHKYKWRSHPLLSTLNRDVAFREMVVVLEGTGKVWITLTGIDGETTTEKFDITAHTTNHGYHPIRLVRPMKLDASDVEVTIYAQGTSTTGPAPVVHRIHLGSVDTNTAPKNPTL